MGSGYEIEFLKSAADQLRKVSRPGRERISAAIDALARDPRPVLSAQLKENPHLHRIRVGSYRIIYQIEDERLVILVVRVSHRRDAYRKLAGL